MITPSYTVVFDFDSDSATYGKFVITDTSDYAGQGISTADVIGYYNIYSPVGVLHLGSYASPDISVGHGVYNTLNIPKDANGNYIQGTYTFQFYIRVAGAVQAGDYNTVVSSYKYCQQFPDAGDVSFTYECICLKITVRDLSEYGNPTTLSRVLSVIPPQGLNPQPSTGTTSSSSLVYRFSYTGAYVGTVNTLLTYVDGIFTVSARVFGRNPVEVVCNINFCKLINCYTAYFKEAIIKIGKRGTFFDLPIAEQNNFILIYGAYIGFTNSFECGESAETQYYYDMLSSLLKCDCRCSCEGTPTLISPLCGGSGSDTITVVAAGSGVTVESETVGDTTTYTVSIAQSILDEIAALIAMEVNVVMGTATFNSAITYPAVAAITATGSGFTFTKTLNLQNEEGYTVAGSGSGGINQLGTNFYGTVTGVTAQTPTPEFNRDIRGYVQGRGKLNLNHALFKSSSQLFVPLFKIGVSGSANGYRPATGRIFPVSIVGGQDNSSIESFAFIEIDAAGNWTFRCNGNATFPMDIMLDTINYKAEA